MSEVRSSGDLASGVGTSPLSILRTMIGKNEIQTPHLRTLAITTDKLDALAVTAAKIAAGTITASEIAAGAITAIAIAADSITAAHIQTGAVEADEIAANAVTTAKLNALAVTAGKIAANAVTTAKLDALAVTAGKIAADAVIAAKIDAGAVTTAKLDAGAVTAGKITVADLVDIANLLTVAAGRIVIGANALGVGLDGILVNDGVNDRVLLGEIAAGDYGLTIKDAEGNTMISLGSFTFGNAKARAYSSAPVVIEPAGGVGGSTFVRLDTETYDPGNNFDNSTWFSGTTTATTGGKLEDGGATFTADLVDFTVKNTTDNTWAQVFSVESGTVLVLSADIFVNNEGYSIIHSKFVAKIAGDYFCTGQGTFFIDDPALIDESFTIALFKNGIAYTTGNTETGSKPGSRSVAMPVVDVIPLAIGDRVELYMTVTPNIACTLIPNTAANTFLACHLLSKT